MIVVDASATLAWSHRDEVTPELDALLRRVVVEGGIVPALWPTEVANSLRIAIRENRIDAQIRQEILDSLRLLKFELDPVALDRVWHDVTRLADTHDLTAYDATYPELALRLRLPLATTDKKLARAARLKASRSCLSAASAS